MDFTSRIGPRALSVGVLGQWPSQHVGQYIKERALSPNCRDRDDECSIEVRELADFLFDLLHEPDLEMRATTMRLGALKEDSLAGGIAELMQCEYWHRIWIIQEISLAREAIVLCGEKRVALEYFEAAFSALSLCRSYYKNFLPETRYFAFGLSGNFNNNIALTTRRKHRQSENVQLGGIVYQLGVPPGRPHYSATDARDIVFGLLGILTEEGALGLHVDYNMTIPEVFTALTRALIDNKDVFDYGLDRCIPRLEGDSSFGFLPSWVPDWQVIGRSGAEVVPVNHGGGFNATAEMPPPPRPSNCNKDDTCGLLHYRGCYVDIITEVMQVQECSSIADSKAWLASVRDFAKLGLDSGPGEDYVWRTIMKGRVHGVRKPNIFEERLLSDEKASILRKIMRGVPIVLEELTQEQKEYIWSELINPASMQYSSKTLEKQLEFIVSQVPLIFGSAARGRTLFKTTKGMLGLGHVAIQPGDIVTLLWGVQSPIILRPRGGKDGGGFTFVGDGYVDGIMYGEFLKTAPAHEDFEIY